MNNRNSRILTFLFALLLGSCTKEGPNQPPNLIEPENLLQNGSFEQNGQPTSNGWYFLWPPDSSEDYRINFSNDVPQNGGTWSLKFDSLNKYSLSFVTNTDLPTLDHKYELSFWAKSQYQSTNVSLMVTGRGWNISWGRIVYVEDSTWREYKINDNTFDSLYQQIPDSIRIFQVVIRTGYDHKNYGKVMFDHFILKRTD